MHDAIAILGGGITGLSAGYAASEAGLQATVYEAAERAGGLLDNFELQGFRFDHAVHLSFGNEPEVRAILDKTPWHDLPAESRCHDQGYWLKHPVQNNLYPLPVDQRLALIESFLARPELTPDNYRDWLIHQYGDAIAARFPLRYTEKYWTLPAEQLGIGWIGNRMRRADISEILYGAMTDETPNTYYIKTMRYPDQGGFRSFLDPLLASVSLKTGHRVCHIDHQAHRIQFASGASTRYDTLINTLPLPVLIGMMADVPDPIRTAANSLFATSVDLVSVGFADQRIQELWFYIYDEDILAARAYSPSVKSADNAPSGCSSLQFEIYSSPRSPQQLSSEALIENTLYGLEKLGIASRSEVLFTDCRRIPYGNVVFDLGMEERRDMVLDWLKHQGIHSVGRFGAWDYLWSHQCLLQGLQVIDTIRGRTP